MPIAPSPALIFPPMLIKSKNGKSAGFDGTGLSFPFHNTNLGALGSPNTKSSFKPLSTWTNHKQRRLKFTNQKTLITTLPINSPTLNSHLQHQVSLFLVKQNRFGLLFVSKLNSRRSDGSRAYHHSEHRIRRLKAIGTFFPEKTILFTSDNVASNTILSLGHNQIRCSIRVLRNERLSNA